MSEKQAKLKRKSAETTEIKKKKNPKNVIATVAAVLVVAAIAGVGGYASWQEIKANRPASTDTTDVSDTAQTQTVADLAESEGMSVDELLEKGKLTDSGLTADSDAQEFNALLTVEGFAAMQDMTADEIRAQYGLEGEKDDTLWSEASMNIKMSKIAEDNGMGFDEFKENSGIPEEITADMTYGEAMEIIQNSMASESENN